MSQSPKVDFSSIKQNITNESSNSISKNEETQSNNKKRNSFSNILQDNKNFIEKKNFTKGDSSPNINYYYNSFGNSPIVDYYAGVTINHNYYTPDDIYKKKEDNFFDNNNNINSKTMPYPFIIIIFIIIIIVIIINIIISFIDNINSISFKFIL